jgi:hypothetical protein
MAGPLRETASGSSDPAANRAKLGPAGATYFINGRPGTEQGFNNTATDNATLRFTWQASQRNKITTYRDQFVRYQSHFAGNNTTDWATVPEIYGRGKQYSWPTKWTSTVTNRLLVEAGFSYHGYDNTIFEPQEGVLKAEGTPEWYANASRLDLGTLNQTVAGGDDCCFRNVQPSNAYNATVSYVTGSHQVKAGVQGRWGHMEISTKPNNGALQQRYLSGRPNSVTVAADPTVSREEISRDVGFFAQDRWTIDRLTVNVGIRFEVFKAGVGVSSSPAGRFVPARNQAAFTVFDFKDALPRFSAVYDLFGNAKTALKFSAGRYVQVIGTTQINTGYSPLSGASDTRNWFDCDLLPGSRTTCSDRVLPTNGDNIAQDNEIPASTNPTFGLRATLRTDPDNLNRESSWDFSASVQHEIMPRVSITAAWYHVRESNLWSSNEAAFTLDSFSPFQVVNPLNSADTITIYNLKSGVPTGNQIVRSSDINRRAYNGVELSVQARFPKGGALTGVGTSTGSCR